MAAYLLAQFLLLIANRLVPVMFAPEINAPHCSAETTVGRLAFDDPVALPGTTPEMGEAQKVKSPRTVMRLVLAPWHRRGRPAEGDESRFVWMGRQSVFAKTLRNNFHHALGIAVVAEPNGKVIRKADQEGSAPETWLDLANEPSS
jgi:hypothetical protein